MIDQFAVGQLRASARRESKGPIVDGGDETPTQQHAGGCATVEEVVGGDGADELKSE